MQRKAIEFPARPYLPPSAALASTCALTAIFTLLEGWSLHALDSIVPMRSIRAVGIAVLVLLIFVAVLSHKAKISQDKLCTKLLHVRKYLLFSLVGLSLGCIASCAWLLHWKQSAQALSHSLSAYTIRFISDPSLGSTGTYSSTSELLDKDSDAPLARVRVTSSEAFEQGELIQAVGRITPLDDSDWEKSRFMKGEVASVQIIKVQDRRVTSPSPATLLREQLLQVINPASNEENALVAGTLLGRTTELSHAKVNEDFARCGLSHLIAISGSHLAFISVLVEALLKRFRFRGSSRRVCNLVIMSGYVVLSGCAPSAVRSVVMVGASSATATLKRRGHPLSGLSCAACILIMLNPGVVFDLGFQLSFMSVLFLLVFSRYISFILMRLHIPKGVSEVLSLTLAAQWATLPITIPLFNEISIVAPLANIVVGPLMSALLVTGLICVPIALIPGLSWVLFIPYEIARLSAFVADALSHLPYASIAVDVPTPLVLVPYLAAIVMYITWRPWSTKCIISALISVSFCIGAHVAYWLFFAPLSISVLNVGQADCILIRDGAHNVLVDAGVDKQARTALARNNVFHLDAVVITHWDKDHWGGLPDILLSIPIDRIIVAQGAVSSMPDELKDLQIEVIELSKPDVLHVGQFTCEMIWPTKSVKGTENEDSLCLDVTCRTDNSHFNMLLTGDTERDQLIEYAKEAGDIDVLKVGHHGSKVSVDKQCLEILKPELAIASAGENNSYGHPHKDCVEVLHTAHATFLCTKDVGDVCLYPRKDRIDIKTTNRINADLG